MSKSRFVFTVNYSGSYDREPTLLVLDLKDVI